MKNRCFYLVLFILCFNLRAFAIDFDQKGSKSMATPSLILLQPEDKSKTDVVLPFLEPSGEKQLISQSEPEELSHSAISSVLQKKDLDYYIETGGAIPIYDKHFRDFIDYGASVNLGLAKRLKSDLTLTASVGVIMMTGKWSIKGDRHSIDIAAESWTPGIINQTGQVTITPEDVVPQENLGTGVHSEGTVVITSSENLNSLDVDTTLYLFPVKVGALYCFPEVHKINPYVGGGVGVCFADRKVESRALKEKYFDGPEYGIKLNKSQTITGMLLDFVAGVNVPYKKNMNFFAEVGTTFLNLQDFDPILEVSYEKTRPTPFTATDITTFSYEDPRKIGVFSHEFITNISVGLIVAF